MPGPKLNIQRIFKKMYILILANCKWNDCSATTFVYWLCNCEIILPTIFFLMTPNFHSHNYLISDWIFMHEMKGKKMCVCPFVDCFQLLVDDETLRNVGRFFFNSLLGVITFRLAQIKMSPLYLWINWKVSIDMYLVYRRVENLQMDAH